ncbi:hypothetical protein OKW21_006060 [Catalinimonas alkaloidigena]|uniref:hypothetical protein n=1 Tax=Catalinimonas alkaloidigena TaxID=1075417 RepID=UPI002406C9A4|nr:hypothetical protein [Catalinimonas alkaloidigena]MDF9800797.1 hypothetical protein [Catalinimonas alkaloidigena]
MRKLADYLIKYIPLITSLLIILGTINQISYYNNFEILIIDYLEISEILILFFNDIITISSSIGFLLLAFIYDFFKKNKYNNNIKTRNTNYFNKSYLKYKWIISYSDYLFFVLYLIVMGISLIYIYNNKSESEERFYLNLAFFSVIIILISKGNKHLNPTKNLLIYSVIIILITNLIKANADIKADRVKERDLYQSTFFILDGKHLIQSDSTCYYIGKTKNYLFYYDADQERTTVYPMSRVSQLTL